MPSDFTYADLIRRCGETLALVYLAEIERAAGIKPQMGNADPEARLAFALHLQDKQKRFVA
jgi:hypothetical protein